MFVLNWAYAYGVWSCCRKFIICTNCCGTVPNETRVWIDRGKLCYRAGEKHSTRRILYDNKKRCALITFAAVPPQTRACESSFCSICFAQLLHVIACRHQVFCLHRIKMVAATVAPSEIDWCSHGLTHTHTHTHTALYTRTLYYH